MLRCLPITGRILAAICRCGPTGPQARPLVSDPYSLSAACTACCKMNDGIKIRNRRDTRMGAAKWRTGWRRAQSEPSCVGCL
ncbi:hypothetical protein WJX72_011050 [[Myrmecia] bisecta]|uniref:Secreted protein n=1 Tax=[Myrmecia] bisecta TaxID=41462 RepID=A0AAW1PYL8_9CHLO